MICSVNTYGEGRQERKETNERSCALRVLCAEIFILMGVSPHDDCSVNTYRESRKARKETIETPSRSSRSLR